MGPRYCNSKKGYIVTIKSKGTYLVDKTFYPKHYESDEACKAAAEKCYKSAMALKKRTKVVVRKSLVGDTMLAAVLVDRVAMMISAIARATQPGL